MQNKPSKAVLRQIINACLDKLYANDEFLIVGKYGEEYTDKKRNGTHYVGERSIVFRFAYYLQNHIITDSRFSDYVVDCEYNRHRHEVKHYMALMADGKTKKKMFYPDVVIHERGNDKRNLMVIEFKAYWNRNTSNDKAKLSYLTKKKTVNEKCTYGYDYGVSIVIEQIRSEVQMDWYADGHKLN